MIWLFTQMKSEINSLILLKKRKNKKAFNMFEKNIILNVIKNALSTEKKSIAKLDLRCLHNQFTYGFSLPRTEYTLDIFYILF